MNRLYLLLVCCMLVLAGAGQSLRPFAFAQLTMVNGLASNEINSMVQDPTGYLWIASNNGLQRFDGVQLRTFKHREGDSASLPENTLSQVHLDAKGNLWVLSARGLLGRFDRNRFTFRPVPVQPARAASMRAEKKILADADGNLFLLLRGHELITYDPLKDAFRAAANFIPLPPEWGITTMVHQPGTGKYWLGVQGRSLVVYNHRTGALSYHGHNTENEPAVEALGPARGLSHAFFDRQGRFWFVNWDRGGFPYLIRYNTRKKEDALKTFEFITELKTYNEVYGLMQQADGRIWVRGLQVFGYFNEQEQKFHLIPNDPRNPEGIAFEAINCLYEDREHNLWVSTRNYGIYRYNPSAQYFTNFVHQHPVTGAAGEGSVLAFVEARNGDLLAATWGDGLFRYDQQLNPRPLAIRDPANRKLSPFWDFCASADSNTIWIAGQPGLYHYDQDKGTLFFRNPSVLENRTVRQVVEDPKGNLWLGMHARGVYRWIAPGNTQKDSLVHLRETATAMINVLHADKRGWVWVGTGAEGLFIYEGATGKLMQHWNQDGGREQPGAAICGITEYNDSLVMVASETNLFAYNRNTRTFQRLRFPEALLGSITALQTDASGMLWISTSNALYRYHPRTLSLVMFNRQDGIGNDHFVLSAAYRMKDGRMLFGNNNAFIAFDPAAIRLTGQQPPVVFTNILAGKRLLPVDSVMRLERLVLNAHNNSVTFSFSPLTFASHAPVQYRMEGLDDEWQTADRENRVSFPFLPSGKYTLLLRTINADGIPAAKATMLQIQVEPPFYLTWWFFTILAIMASAILFIIERQRTRRKQELEQVRTDIANGLHQEVNAALNNINILSEIARLKSDREPEKAKEYLEQIHTKSHNMIIALDDMLWSLDPGNDTMDKTISRVREFADALMQRHGVVIDLIIDKNVAHLELDMKLRHEAFLLFKEGLRSLVAAGTPRCVVQLSLDKARLLFSIEFETEGCDMLQLNNLLHRRDMDARIQSLRARLQVHVHKSKSMFMLQLPLTG